MKLLALLLAIPCITSAVWLVVIWIESVIHRKARRWHYCTGCGNYIDPAGHVHDHMPIDSDFSEINNTFITCDNHK